MKPRREGIKKEGLGELLSCISGVHQQALNKPDLMHLEMEARLGLRRVLTKRKKEAVGGT